MTEIPDMLREYRERLLQVEQQMQMSYDKAVMTLSGGALGISLTFTKDIASSPLNATQWLLGAWTSWGLSVACVLISFFSSSMALRRAVRQTDLGTMYLEAVGGPWNTATQWLNPIAGLLFLAGVGLICVFVGGNIQ